MRRFSAYKAVRATDALFSTDGSKEQISAVLNTSNRYQAAEWQTTIARTRTAKQWVDFNADPIKNVLYPNLKWLPSRSATKRELHQQFYNKVFAKNDPFWHGHQPGNLWNCKCDWAETDEPTEQEKGNTSPAGGKAAKGLEGNPAETGKIFSDDASYFQKASKTDSYLKNADERYKKTIENLSDYVDRDERDWEHNHFDKSGGCLVTSRTRRLEAEKKGKYGKPREDELSKFKKEYDMCLALSKSGYNVEYLASRTIPGNTYDILLDGIPADLKRTSSSNHIFDYAIHAVTGQGAQIVIFQIEKMTHYMRKELYRIKEAGIKVKYFVTGKENEITDL